MLDISETLARSIVLSGCGEWPGQPGVLGWSYKDACGIEWEFGYKDGQFFHGSDNGDYEGLTAVECLSLIAHTMTGSDFFKGYLDEDTDKKGPVWWWHPKGVSVVIDWNWHPEIMVEDRSVPYDETQIHNLDEWADLNQDAPWPITEEDWRALESKLSARWKRWISDEEDSDEL